jgi:hypothetical protein
VDPLGLTGMTGMVFGAPWNFSSKTLTDRDDRDDRDVFQGSLGFGLGGGG